MIEPRPQARPSMSEATTTAMARLVQRLESIGVRVRGAVMAEAALVFATAAGVAVPLVIATDAVFRWPAAIRWMILVALGCAAWTAARRWVLPAFRFRPGPLDIALRLERTTRTWSGRLAAAVDLHLTRQGGPGRTAAITAIADTVDPASLALQIETRRLRMFALSSFALLATLAGLVAFFPVESRIGVVRTFMPWTSTRWPARTEVTNLVVTEVAPRGRPLILAGSLVKGDPESERVVAEIERVRDGERLPTEELILTRQSGRRFERPVATDADSIRFSLRTRDHETEQVVVRLEDPPEIRSASLLVEPPDYASGDRVPQRFELGPGTDRRGTVPGAMLAGSSATLALDLVKELEIPAMPARSAWLAETFPGLPGDAEISVDPDDAARWMLSWTLQAPVLIEPRLRDQFGLESTEGATFRIEVVADEPPSVSVLDPARDESVLSTAVLALVAEARDDVSVRTVAIEAVRGDGLPQLQVVSAEESGPRRTFESTLSLESLGAAAGDTIEVTAIATDAFADHDPVRSSPRRLRVVGAEEFSRQVRDELAALRRAAIRVDEEQARLRERAEAPTAAEQAAITGRIGSLEEAVAALEDRLERNRVDDGREAEVTSRARSRAESAAEASRRAEQDLRGPDPESGTEEASESAGERESWQQASNEVRREIQSMVAMLEQDEDTWSLLREIESLAEEVASIERETEDFGRESAGRSVEELSAEQQAALRELARRQAAASASAEQLLDELSERADRVEERDAAQAESLRQAAEAARQSGLEQSMREAEESLEQNRTDQAQQAQQESQQALQRMRDRLEDTRKVRTETLKRLMTELVESIEALLAQSEEESFALRSLVVAGPPWPKASLEVRSSRVIAIERNTRSTEALAASGGDDAEPVARLLERAGDVQIEAVVALRSDPVMVGDSQAAMERSSGLLREALEQARRIGEDAERDAQRQAREELAAAYHELADRQEQLAEETTALAKRILSGEVAARRRLVETRRSAGEQETLGEAAVALASRGEMLEGAAVFQRGHTWVDAWSSEVVSELRSGEAGNAVTSRQQRIAITLRSMAEALESLAEDDEMFAGGEGSASSGSGSSQGGPEEGAIPPIAELRLLRSLQEQVYRGTREIDEASLAGLVDPASRREAVADLAAMQQEIRALGEALLEKLEQEQGGGPPEGEADPQGPAPVGASGLFGSRQVGAKDAPPRGDGDPPRPAAPTLDDLLGIEEDAPGSDPQTDAAAAEAARRLDERLRERPIADDFREAIAGMEMSESLLREAEEHSGELGLGLQRVQEEVIRRLQTLIDSAARQRQQSRSSSSSSSSQSSQQSSPSQQSGESSGSGERRRDGAASEGSNAEPPSFEQAELGRLLEEGRVEWGALPERVRELVRQGSRDRVSSIYRRLTEQYYRRLAEEQRP